MGRPKLNVEEQIDHLKKKGVRFSIISEKEALDYLLKNNNFFKLTAYRKNYQKNREDKYVNLEFAYLRDLAIIDMRIRKCLLDMCLDVEHNTRMKIVRAIELSNNEDGYSIVSDFREAYPAVDECISAAEKSPYCRDIIYKYRDEMPIWALVEILQFGSLCNLFDFLATRLNDVDMTNESYMLHEIRKIRNACAHSNCILNDLKSSSMKTHKPSNEINQALSSIGISANSRKRKMSNDRIRQIVTLLYYYKKHIKSEGLQKYQGSQLRCHFIDRPAYSASYYKNNDQVLSFFKFIKTIVDNWFPAYYNSGTEKKS